MIRSFDRRKRTHRLDRDGLVERDRVEPRHAHQLWHAVDLGRARAAFSGLAVPAAGEIAGRFGLYLMHGVEHDHAFGDLGLVIDHLTARRPAASDTECRFFHMNLATNYTNVTNKKPICVIRVIRGK